jgi:hypothetical protein
MEMVFGVHEPNPGTRCTATGTRPFERISIDLVQLLEQGDRCYNSDKYLFHMVNQDSKWHEGSCMSDKSKATLT